MSGAFAFQLLIQRVAALYLKLISRIHLDISTKLSVLLDFVLSALSRTWQIQQHSQIPVQHFSTVNLLPLVAFVVCHRIRICLRLHSSWLTWSSDVKRQLT